MSQENVDIVVAQFERANAGDAAAVRDAWAEDVTLILHGAASAMSADTTSGKTAVGEWFGDWSGSSTGTIWTDGNARATALEAVGLRE